MRKEFKHEDFNIVFDNQDGSLDTHKNRLIKEIGRYAASYERELKVIFFNGKRDEIGVTFFFKR